MILGKIVCQVSLFLRNNLFSPVMITMKTMITKIMAKMIISRMINRTRPLMMVPIAILKKSKTKILTISQILIILVMIKTSLQTMVQIITLGKVKTRLLTIVQVITLEKIKTRHLIMNRMKILIMISLMTAHRITKTMVPFLMTLIMILTIKMIIRIMTLMIRTATKMDNRIILMMMINKILILTIKMVIQTLPQKTPRSQILIKSALTKI